MPVPPTATTSRGCAKLQKNSKTAVYDGYYAHKQGLHPTVVTIAPPIQTFHQVFQEFVDRVNDPAFEPSDEVVSIISELMSTAAEIDPSEDKALLRLRPLLSRLLGGFVGQVPSMSLTSIGTSTPDGMMLKQPDERAASLVCIEYKRAFGEGGYDPSTQASYSVREFLISPQVHGFHMFCPSPDIAFSPRKSLKSVVAHLSSSPVVVLIWPYSASSILASSLFRDSPTPCGSERPLLTKTLGSTLSHEYLRCYALPWRRWISTTASGPHKHHVSR